MPVKALDVHLEKVGNAKAFKQFQESYRFDAEVTRDRTLRNFQRIC